MPEPLYRCHEACRRERGNSALSGAAALTASFVLGGVLIGGLVAWKYHVERGVDMLWFSAKLDGVQTVTDSAARAADECTGTDDPHIRQIADRAMWRMPR